MSAATEFDNPIRSILAAEDADPEWLIKDLLLQGTLVCLAGEPGAGKSLVSYTLALAKASGWSALSGLVPEGPPERVVYFDQENSPQNRNKYITRSWWGLADSHGLPPDADLLEENFIPVHFHLGAADWFDVAADFISHFQPRLAVFDTAASCFDIEDENNNAEAARVLKQLRQLMTVTDPPLTVLVLKHAKSTVGKGERRKMRGATMWQSLADQVMFQVRCQGRPRKGGLQLTRLVPDKTRAYGLTEEIFITPSYTDEAKTGLLLEASTTPSSEHKRARRSEEGDEDE